MAPFHAVATALALALTACLTVSANSHSCPARNGGSQNGGLVVETSIGTITGIIDSTTPSVRQFLGIPYARPPVDELRFAPPQPADPVSEISATTLPPSCMQYLSNGSNLYTREVLEFNLGNGADINEDCLTLSIWAPVTQNIQHDRGHAGKGRGGAPGYGHGRESWRSQGSRGNGQLLPVLIYFYGGGFTTGGQNVPYQIPAQWVQRTQNLIVVTLNYRLNLFGFPNAAGLDDQNLGLLDQRLAVEWCQQHISSFGGDPSRMTIWGQSAGAMSVDFYNFAYPNDPIVTGLIMNSGTALLPIRSLDTAHSNFSFVASQVGCGGLGPAAELACMRNVPATTLEGFVQSYQDAGTRPSISFVPVVDGRLVFANYTERALQGLQATIPAIIGTNEQDGVPFAPYNPDSVDVTAAQAAYLYVFFCPATTTIRNRIATGRRTFSYLYAGNFTNISPEPWMGAYHSAELPLLFGTHPNFRGPSTPLEYATSAAMQDFWEAFLYDPVNGLPARGWPAYEVPGSGVVEVFGEGVAAQVGSVTATEQMCA